MVEDMPAEIFLRQAKKIAEKMVSKDITVVLTGGEPLLRQNLEDVGRQLRQMGFRWGLVTNGMAYSKTRHARLMGAGMGSVTLSIDGLEEDHNWLRQSARSFTEAERALEILIQTPRLNFDVVTCVNHRNILKLEELYQYLLKKGLRAWRLFTIAPIGRASDNPELLLQRSEFETLMKFIHKKRREKSMKVSFSCEAYVGPHEFEVRDGFFFCRAGIHIGSILADGSVSACPNIDRGFVQGNIDNEDFTQIWDTQFEAFRNRLWTKTGQCNRCKDYTWCKGSGLHLWKYSPREILQCHLKDLRPV